jgi:N-acetylmuramoyl-L-alanine amidase
MSVDYPGAIDHIITDPKVVFTDALLSVSNSDITIIDHKTACGAPCTATSVANGFGQPPDYKSTHFVVGRDGSVIQCVLLKDGAGGNCCTATGYDSSYYDPLFAKYGNNANLFTISIEHEDWTTDNSQVMTQAQIDASNKLNLWLAQRYHMGILQIHSHASLDPVNRARCPGPTFDFQQLFNYIQTGGRGNVVNQSFLQTLFNSVVPGGDMTSGLGNAWQRDVSAGMWRGAPLIHEGSIEWKGVSVPWLLCSGGFYTWESDIAYWHANQ